MSKHGARRERDDDEDEPASRAQIETLRKLLAKVRSRGEDPPIDASELDELNYLEADALIDELKNWLHA